VVSTAQEKHPSSLAHGARYASLTIAITIPARTNATIAICIQIQVGDIR
jgi:hypothetical protein